MVLENAKFNSQARCLRHPMKPGGCSLPYGVDLVTCLKLQTKHETQITNMDHDSAVCWSITTTKHIRSAPSFKLTNIAPE